MQQLIEDLWNYNGRILALVKAPDGVQYMVVNYGWAPTYFVFSITEEGIDEECHWEESRLPEAFPPETFEARQKAYADEELRDYLLEVYEDDIEEE